jgi:ABC-type transport system involved in multi-copper enzyme maturation permease subunit
MNATAVPLQGFWPFFAKELSEWWKGRGALATVVVLSALGTLGTFATRIDELGGGTPTAAQLDPTSNILGAQFEQWIVFASIFASIGMLVSERSSGTLAWTLSKPVSRSALLLAKWSAGTLMLTAFGLVIPLAWTMGIATFAYGELPNPATIAEFGLLLAAAPAFIVALNLALATRLQSQGAIAAIGFAVAVTPYIASTFLPILAELWPTSMAHMATVVASGEAPNLPTITSWAVALVVVGGAGLLIFRGEDL